ncbi:MAG: thioredoxin [Candidatus Neomarinimicrobiota bacterium]
MGANTVEISDQNFEEQVLGSQQPVLVDFWAEWCGPCHMVAPIIEEVAAEYKDKIVVGKLNVDHNPGIAARYGIRGIPTMLLFKDGEVNNQIVGAVPKTHIVDMVDSVLEA